MEVNYIPSGYEKNKLRTHAFEDSDLDKVLNKVKKKINDKKSFNAKELLLILEDLASFPLGQHIILNGGANGAWTDYLISPQEYLENDLTNFDCSFLERFFLFHSPSVLAQRELFRLAQNIAEKKFHDGGKRFASIPCGIMRDLLNSNFSFSKEVSLIGVDLDPLSLELASQLALKLNISNVSFIEKDAWNLGYNYEFDFINSIGLNVYESDRESVIELYNQLYRALKTDGILFTGVLTWPPYIDKSKSEWVIDKIPKFDLHLEKIIHKDLLDLKWLNFRKLDEMELDFKRAGFSRVEICQDSRCVFPAIIAKK